VNLSSDSKSSFDQKSANMRPYKSAFTRVDANGEDKKQEHPFHNSLISPNPNRLTLATPSAVTLLGKRPHPEMLDQKAPF